MSIEYEQNEILKKRFELILKGEDVADDIKKNIDIILVLIPEINNIIGFEHKHPHHHLDVWNHTLEVIRNLHTTDLELNMAALLHDIGKPFSYQDEEVRHFHGHPEMGYEMAKEILIRLQYDKKFIDRVSYLVLKHDEIIDPNNLDNAFELVEKRLKLQFADAKAHKPDKIEKRLKFLNDIEKELNNKERE